MLGIIILNNKNTKSLLTLVSKFSIFIIFISFSYLKSQTPPFNDYCKMLEKDINGIQHGFLAGNKMYYVGGQTGAFWDGVSEHETIGLTHPFFRDMRSRGYGMTKTDYGIGNDKWGWEFYRLSKAAYGTVIANGKEYKHPKPEKMIWRPDRQLTEYIVNDIVIQETKFITLNDVVCSIIKSSKPIKIKFKGSGFYNKMNLPTFDGDEEGIPWQQNVKSKIKFQPEDNCIRLDESSDMMVKPTWGEKAVVGKMMYEGMSVVISTSESMEKNYSIEYDENNVPNYEFTINCDSSGSAIFYSIADDYEEAVRNIKDVRKNIKSALESKTNYMNELLNYQIPYFRCSDDEVVDTYYYLWAIYFMYFMDVGEGYLEYPNTQTAINNFMGLHLWDSSVYARMGSWVVDKWEYGFGNVLNWKNLLPYKKKGGRLPDNFGINWYSPVWFTPIYTIPGAWMMYTHSGDKKYLKEAYNLYFELYKDGFQTDPAFVLLSTSILKKMAKELRKRNDIKLWDKKYTEALNDLNNSWEIKSEKYYGSYNYQGKDIWNLAALMAKEFPDDWARALTDRWIMNTEDGFLGPVALDVRAKSAVQNGIFEVSTISTWQVIEGLFENGIDKEAVHITLSHLKGMYKDYGFPIAPEVWTPEYKPWGSMYYNWDGAIVLPILKRLAGFDFSVSDKTIMVSDHFPPSWDYIDLKVPITTKKDKVEWVELYIDRKKTEEGIIKSYNTKKIKDWTLEINPWLEGRDIIEVKTSMNEYKNEGENGNLFQIEKGIKGDLNLKLGEDNNPLRSRVLVLPESRKFIDQISIELKNLMGKGTLLYKDPSSKDYNLYKGPIEIRETGILKVKVSEESISDFVYEIKFTKQEPLESVKVASNANGLTYKYYEGVWEKIPEYKSEKILADGHSDGIVTNVAKRKENYGLVLSGYILIPKTNIYTFYLRSNDGSRLKIGDEIISEINGTAGLDPIFAAPSRIALEEGYHTFEIEYFQKITRSSLFVEIESDEITKQNIPISMLYR